MPVVVSSAASPLDIRPILGHARSIAPAAGDLSRAELLAALADALIAMLSVSVDEVLLVLAAGRIAGAGLDVLEAEPAVHPGLLGYERAVLAPHAGSATTTARRRMAEICAHAVRTVLAGDGSRPATIINPEIYS